MVSSTTELPGSSLAAMVRGTLDAFSSGERKVARAVLANYPIAGLETVAELATRANVSPPTVVRFVARLGFTGYPAFQKVLMREVQESLGSPLAQYGHQRRVPAGEEFLGHAREVFTGRISDSFAEVPQSEFTAAVSLVCDPRRSVGLVGGRFSRMLAGYLGAHLDLLRRGVDEVPHEEIARLGVVTDSSKADLYVVFDYRRYDLDTVRFAQRVADRGSEVVLFTDRWLSPAADVASVVLPVHVESPSPFDSLVPAMALVEALIAAVAERLGETGRSRIEAIEAMRGRRQSATPQ